MERNLTRGPPVVYQGHLTRLGPFRERPTPAHEKKQEGCARGGGSAGLQNGQRRKCSDASFEKHDDAMQMMTWQNATCKQMTWQRRRITGRHLAHRIRGITEGNRRRGTGVCQLFAVLSMSCVCMLHFAMSSSALHHHVFQNLHPYGFPSFSCWQI